jgi:hypothetical protein
VSRELAAPARLAAFAVGNALRSRPPEAKSPTEESRTNGLATGAAQWVRMTLPAAGAYRGFAGFAGFDVDGVTTMLGHDFLQFKRGGIVHTAPFTVRVAR